MSTSATSEAEVRMHNMKNSARQLSLLIITVYTLCWGWENSYRRVNPRRVVWPFLKMVMAFSIIYIDLTLNRLLL